MEDKKIFQLMHKYGKLTSCNHEEPHPVDKLFVKELQELNKNE